MKGDKTKSEKRSRTSIHNGSERELSFHIDFLLCMPCYIVDLVILTFAVAMIVEGGVLYNWMRNTMQNEMC